jgi:hypothetical protein
MRMIGSNCVHATAVAAVLLALFALRAAAAPPPAEWRLIGWNDLGMHCMDGTDFSDFSILPPYNTFHAHLLHNGRLVTNDLGIDTFTFAARDGEKDSNLAAGTVTVTGGPCVLAGAAFAPVSAAAHVDLPFWAAFDVSDCAASLSWQWTFGDGSTASGSPEPTHAYLRNGTYDWQVVVQAGAATVTNNGIIVVGATSIDTDGDGIEDDWEWERFGSLTNANAVELE